MPASNSQMQDRDEAVERVVAIDVVHLLAAEGAHSAAVSQQLQASEVWQVGTAAPFCVPRESGEGVLSWKMPLEAAISSCSLRHRA